MTIPARLLSALLALPLGGCELAASAATVPPTAPSEYAAGGPTDDGTPRADECSPVAQIECGGVVSADTADFNHGATWEVDSYPVAVGRFDGPEIAYALEAPATGDVTFRLVDPVPTFVDHDVFVLRSSDGACRGEDAVARGANGVTVELTAGESVYVVVDGYDGAMGGFTLAVDCDGVEAGGAGEPPADEPPADASDPDCAGYHSDEQESAPIQTVAALPARAWDLTWQRPAAYTSWIDFDGSVGSAAVHEGIDYVHDDESDAVVDVMAAAGGTVAYVRTGCPESSRFGRNDALRECGSGWGNHVIVDHGEGLFSRYAHLADGDVRVEAGDVVARGRPLGGMGNSGRSETRHLHFEVGSDDEPFDPCAPARSFDFVHPPAPLGAAP